MKLIIRADDLGFSEAINLGINKAVTDGVVSSVGMMPYVQVGYEIIKNKDICIGQHTNICVGKPICDSKQIRYERVAEHHNSSCIW